MQDLQARFKDRLQVVLVSADTSESADKVVAFLDMRKKLTNFKLTLPYAVQNPFLVASFPFKVIPQYVWINSTAEVVGITSADELTKENIERVLETQKATLKEKNDKLLFNTDLPFLVKDNGTNDNGFIYRSVFTSFQPNLGSTIANKTDDRGGISRYSVINYRLKTFLQLAYPETSRIPHNRLIVEGNVAQGLLDQKYCYELNTPPISDSQVRALLREDLYRAFGTRLKIEKRAFDTYELNTNSNLKKSISKGEPAYKNIEDEGSVIILRNQPVNRLEGFLSGVLKKPVIITSATALLNIDVSFPAGFTNWPFQQQLKFLSAIGFDLKERQQGLDAVIVYQPIVNPKK
ncbi:hypothetical protein GGU45_001433 [Niabella hirudinis]